MPTSSGKSIVTKEQITAGLREIGLPGGAIVMVHSSLSSFGYVEGGAPAVVEALLNCVGPKGTVMVPTQPFRGSEYVYMKARPTFDVRSTPSLVGAITEAVRHHPRALRSLHPSHPVAAIGPLAVPLLRDHEKAATSCGLGTPFFRNIVEGGYILLLGVDNRRNTTLHTIEEVYDGDVLSEETFDAVIVDYEGRTRRGWCRPHAPNRPRNFPRVETDLLAAGAMNVGRIGDAEVRLIDARRLLEIVSARLREDPRYLLASN